MSGAGGESRGRVLFASCLVISGPFAMTVHVCSTSFLETVQIVFKPKRCTLFKIKIDLTHFLAKIVDFYC